MTHTKLDLGVHHVSINVDDVEVAGKFYREVLGLEQLPRPDFGFPGMWLRTGPQEVHLIQVEKHSAPEGQHFAFRVKEIASVVSEITSHGVEVVGPFPGAGGGWQAFLRDPAGNLIELNQPES